MMQMTLSRQSLVRLVGVIAIAIGLFLPGSTAAAFPQGPALRECMEDGCAVVTERDLATLRRNARLGTEAPLPFPTDRFSPHFER